MVRVTGHYEALRQHLPAQPAVEAQRVVSAVGPQHLVALAPEALRGCAHQHPAYASLSKLRLYGQPPQSNGPGARPVRSSLGREAGHGQECAVVTGHPEVQGPGHVVLGEGNVGVRSALPEHAPAKVVGVDRLDLDDAHALS